MDEANLYSLPEQPTYKNLRHLIIIIIIINFFITWLCNLHYSLTQYSYKVYCNLLNTELLTAVHTAWLTYSCVTVVARYFTCIQLTAYIVCSIAILFGSHFFLFNAEFCKGNIHPVT